MTSILDRIASKFISYKPSICHITTKKITFTAFFPQTLNSCGRNQTLPTLATMNQINLGVPSSVTKRFKHPHKVLARAQGLKSPGNWWSILADREDRGDQARSCQIEWRAVVMSTPVSASACIARPPLEQERWSPSASFRLQSATRAQRVHSQSIELFACTHA